MRSNRSYKPQIASRLQEYRNGLNGAGEGRWGALGRREREAQMRRREARRNWRPPVEETVEEEVPAAEPEPEPEVVPEPVEEL